MTAIFTKPDDIKKHFNREEIETIRAKAESMLSGDIVEQYFPIGAHDVCLKRESRDAKVIQIARMEVPMWRNNANVHGMNSRPKKASA